MNGFIVANIWPTKPSGVQLISPMTPPGRQTRTNSSAASWWCGANITPTQETTASNSSLPNGSASALAVRQVRLTPRASAIARPRSSRSGHRSLAITSAPAIAAGIATLPEPAATSSTRSPAPIPLACTSIGPSGATTSVATVV